MRLPLPVRLAWKELVAHKKFSFLFVLNLALGLVGLVTLISFEDSFQQHMAANSKALLGADLSISARRFIKDSEEDTASSLLPATTLQTKTISLYSMVASPQRSRLVEIKAIGAAFPFYGKVKLQGIAKEGLSPLLSLQHAPQVWVYPELLAQLGIKIGEQVKIGSRSFTVSAVVEDDSPATWAGTSLAPRLYMDYEQLLQTGLLQPGATLWQAILYKVPLGVDTDLLVKDLNLALTDPGVRVQSHREASEQTARLVNYLSDYLGLAALAAFFLAIIATSYFYFSYFTSRVRELAILIALGMPGRSVITLFLLQVLMLGAVAAALSLSVSIGLLHFIVPPLTHSLFSVSLAPTLTLQGVVGALIVSLLGSFLSCLPFLMPILAIKPSLLLQEDSNGSLSMGRRHLWTYLPAGLVFWLLAVWQAHSWKVGSLFILCFGAAALVFTLIYWAATLWAERSYHPRQLAFKLAKAQLTRKPLSSLIAFLALSLGALLINLIPQLRHSLTAELTHNEAGELPSFFLFDIQPEQLDPLAGFLSSQATHLTYLSPLIAARLTQINGEAFAKAETDATALTREEQREQATRSRTYNLSYRADLAPSETLVAGRPFSPLAKNKDAGGESIAEISLEERFGQRLGVRLGDHLSFDVEGVTISGQVVNFRRVRWTSFQPNFFIQFQPGPLDEAPKTFLAAIPRLAPEKLEGLQNELAQNFPNVSVVNVSRVVATMVKLSERMAFILSCMALLTLLTGFVVLFSIAHYQSKLRLWDITLLKVLGASTGVVRKSLYLEFLSLSLAAALAGGVLASGGSYLFTKLVFNGQWRLDWQVPAGISLAMVVIGLVISHLANFALFRSKAADILN